MEILQVMKFIYHTQKNSEPDLTTTPTLTLTDINTTSYIVPGIDAGSVGMARVRARLKKYDNANSWKQYKILDSLWRSQSTFGKLCL